MNAEMEMRHTHQATSIPIPRLSVSASPGWLAARAFLRHRSGMLGLSITTVMVLLAILAPRIVPYDALAMHAADAFHAPSAAYLMGTDEFGRDIFSRILMGGRISLGVGFAASGLAALFGILAGLLAGFYGGWLDAVAMRICDALLAFPAILLAIVILAVLGPGSLTVILAVAIVSMPAFTRLTRAQVLAERVRDYVQAAEAVGVPPLRVLMRHILPNVTSILLVQISVTVASAVLLEASLSFLGLGTPPPAPSWGSMLSMGRGYLPMAPWYGIFPGLAITLFVMGFYLLGDGLRDALDPRRQKR
jgi:peptide/nickel transport system permease protein